MFEMADDLRAEHVKVTREMMDRALDRMNREPRRLVEFMSEEVATYWRGAGRDIDAAITRGDVVIEKLIPIHELKFASSPAFADAFASVFGEKAKG